jgi:hypothetical protein
MTVAPPEQWEDTYQEMIQQAVVTFDHVRILSILLGTLVWAFGDVIYIYGHHGLFPLIDALVHFGAPLWTMQNS